MSLTMSSLMEVNRNKENKRKIQQCVRWELSSSEGICQEIPTNIYHSSVTRCMNSNTSLHDMEMLLLLWPISDIYKRMGKYFHHYSQYSTLYCQTYRTTAYHTMHGNTTWHDIIWSITIWYNTIWYHSIWIICITRQDKTRQDKTRQDKTRQYDMIH